MRRLKKFVPKFILWVVVVYLGLDLTLWFAVKLNIYSPTLPVYYPPTYGLVLVFVLSVMLGQIKQER